jgi:hypothetical protein
VGVNPCSVLFYILWEEVKLYGAFDIVDEAAL